MTVTCNYETLMIPDDLPRFSLNSIIYISIFNFNSSKISSNVLRTYLNNYTLIFHENSYHVLIKDETKEKAAHRRRQIPECLI